MANTIKFNAPKPARKPPRPRKDLRTLTGDHEVIDNVHWFSVLRSDDSYCVRVVNHTRPGGGTLDISYLTRDQLTQLRDAINNALK